jgi:hypothetical protein
MRSRIRKGQANVNLRDFDSIVSNMSEQELNELQADIDRRKRYAYLRDLGELGSEEPQGDCHELGDIAKLGEKHGGS